MARDLSSLKRAPKTEIPDGITPDRNPFLGPAFIREWQRLNADIIGPRAKAHDTPFRHSDAGWCAHSLALSAQGVPDSDPPSAADSWNMSLGSKIHEWVDPALQAAFPGAEFEVKLATGDGLGSGHSDVFLAVVTQRDGKRVVVELKTINGYGYKTAVGAQCDAVGPKDGYVTQLALNTKAHDADLGIIWYLSRELISKDWARRIFGPDMLEEDLPLWVLGQFSAEWTYPRAELELIAVAELERWAWIKALMDAGEEVPRIAPGMPDGAVVVNPRRGVWEIRAADGALADSGKTWQCAYCRHLTTCANELI